MTSKLKDGKARRGALAGPSPGILAAALAAAFTPLAASAQPIELGPLRVEDQNQGPNTLMSETGLARVPSNVQDTPQAINVIPQVVLQQQNVTTLDQALRNVAGLTVGVGEGGGAFNGDQFRIRGFDAKDDIYIDGLRDFGVYTRDSFNYESVQVLKGPSSGIFGRGTTGGGINTQSKTPILDNFAAATASIGNGPYYRTVADANYQIDNTTAVRLNMMFHRQDIVSRDLVKSDRWGIAPSIGFGIGTGTSFTLSYLHQQDERIPDYGVPTLIPTGQTISRPVTETTSIDRSTFYGFSRDYDNTSADIVTAKFQHAQNDWLTLYNDARVGVYGRDFSATRVSCNNTAPSTCLSDLYDNNTATVPMFVPGGAASGTGPYGMALWGAQDIATAVVTAPLFGLRNQLVAGIDVSYVTSKRRFYNYSAARPNRDAFNPDHSAVYSIVALTVPTAIASSYAQGTDYAAFASNQLWFNDQWSVVFGGRLDSYDVRYEAVTVGKTFSELTTKATLFNPKTSLVFEPSETQTYYFSWAKSATPQGTSVTNQPTPVSGTVSAGGVNTRDLEPEENEIYEVGAKFGLFENRLGLQASAFMVMKNNAKLDDGLGNIVSSGDAQEIRGFELGLTGQLMENWSILANYTFLDSETTESFTGTPPALNTAAIGKEVPNVPKHSASLWTTYRFMPGLTGGVGMSYADKVFLNNTNLAIAPRTFSVDALISYELMQWRFALNVTNLTDELNYAGSQNGRAVPAPGRTFIFSVGTVF